MFFYNAGYQNVAIRPRLWGGISNAVVSFRSIHGTITNTWFWTNVTTATNFSMALTIPANITASVYVPSTNLGTILQGGAPVTNAPGVLGWEVQATNNAAVFRLGSGTYNFSAPGINL